MSLANIKLNSQSERGFTIVELLIVVVVIAILAAITIVSYNGITNNAKKSSAQAAATTFAKKAELYYSEESSYPDAAADLTGAASSEPYAMVGVTGITYTGANITAAPTEPNSINIAKCQAGATPANQAAITTPTGLQVKWWNYVDNTQAIVTVGNVGTPGTACPTS